MDAMRKTFGLLTRRFPAVVALAKPFIARLSPIDAPQPAFVALEPVVPIPMRGKVEADAHLTAVADANGLPGIGTCAIGREVLMLVVSDLRIDPRVRREARALAAEGYRVTVVCPSPFVDTQPPPEVYWGGGIEILYVGVACGSYVGERPGFMGGLLFDVLERLLAGRSFLAIHAHDLNTAYVAFALARCSGAHLVADFHEWTSENVHWNDGAKVWQPYPPGWKDELEALEMRILREASEVVTVCDSIADALADELGGGRRPQVIRNVPALTSTPSRAYQPLKAQLGLSDEQFVLLWQGGTGPTRLIEPIIEALEFAPHCVFVIRGPSLDAFGQQYQAIAERVGAADRLILQGPVPSGDVVAAACGADAGIWTLPRLCRNFTYALPNKIFEYVAAGLPTLVADYPEARRLVETHKVGLTFDPYAPKSIAKAINRLIDDPAFARSCRENTVAALATLDADAEWQKLVMLYDGLRRTEAAAH
jgi:starch synthase